MDSFSAVRICAQIAVRNTVHSSKAVAYELLDQDYNPKLDIISTALAAALNDIPSIEVSHLSTALLQKRKIQKMIFLNPLHKLFILQFIKYDCILSLILIVVIKKTHFNYLGKHQRINHFRKDGRNNCAGWNQHIKSKITKG